VGYVQSDDSPAQRQYVVVRFQRIPGDYIAAVFTCPLGNPRFCIRFRLVWSKKLLHLPVYRLQFIVVESGKDNDTFLFKQLLQFSGIHIPNCPGSRVLNFKSLCCRFHEENYII